MKLELDNYYIDIDKILKEISKNNCKKVLLQFAEGLKLYSEKLIELLEKKTNNKIDFIIWLDTCFGACDIPILPKNLEKEIDLIIQIGHNNLMPKY